MCVAHHLHPAFKKPRSAYIQVCGLTQWQRLDAEGWLERVFFIICSSPAAASSILRLNTEKKEKKMIKSKALAKSRDLHFVRKLQHVSECFLWITSLQAHRWNVKNHCVNI